MKKILFLTAFTGLFAETSSAQDLHFSQFFVSPMLQNPAMTGFFNGDFRATMIVKNQWNSVTTPYKTVNGGLDIRFVKGKNYKDLLGIGMNLTSDKAGDSKFTSNNFGFNMAYNYCLDNFGMSYLSGGINITYLNATIDYTNLVFGDQYAGNPTAENAGNTTFSAVDVSAGAQWSYIPDHSTTYSAGAAIYHANQPSVSFMGDGSSKLPYKAVVNAAGQFSLNRKIEFYPKLQASMQGTNYEILFGSFTRIDLDPSNSVTRGYAVYVGGWYRVGDAFIPVARFDVNRLSISFSYDVNLSKLFAVSNARGGPELSLIMLGKIPGFTKKQVFCPRF